MLKFIKDSLELNTIVDFLRYGITHAHQQSIYCGHGMDNIWDDIWTLVAGTLSLPFDCDPILLHSKLTAAEKLILSHQLKLRIIDRIPSAYVLKQANFSNLNFYVDERVLIPRSPFAELIQKQFIPWINPEDVAYILDFGTGSGCIAIASCYAFPEAHVDAIDISLDALAVAEINRSQHQLESQLDLIQSDGWTNVPDIHYDLIIANPPYIAASEMQTLPAEYLHEPKYALQAGDNGLAIIEQILQHATTYLSDDGILIVEVGNAEAALIDAHPNVPFVWLEFEHGGSGVFLLTRKALTGISCI